jgi:hypothetical protein
LHQFIPLVKGSQVGAVGRVVVVAVFLEQTVISLILSGYKDSSVIKICSHPALCADLNCGIGFIVTDIGERVATVKDAGVDWTIM